MWKNLNDSWPDELNYSWPELSFRTWGPAIWMCDQEQRHTENSKPTSESFSQKTNDPDQAGEEVLNHYTAEGSAMIQIFVIMEVKKTLVRMADG